MPSRVHPFAQVDVFSQRPLGGNPVAVVLDADGLDGETMAAFARWTNLSETTFVLDPSPAARELGADYRLRIFTPAGELPFAGHPTLGSAHAWLEAGGAPARGDRIVQECGVGLVPLRREGGVLSFAAPPLVRSGPLTAEELEPVLRFLRLDGEGRAHVLDAAWIDNGPGWLGVRLDSAEAVLALRPDPTVAPGAPVGVVGAQPAGAGTAVEVRGFVAELGIAEDPVTGSLNASLAQWLIGAGVLPERYTAAQGTALGRSGRVHVESREDGVWVGGATTTVLRGTVALGGTPPGDR